MNRILFIVEGENDEVKFINQLFQKCNISQKYEIVPYKTNLHNLANLLLVNNKLDESLDIKNVLKEIAKDEKDKERLSQDFSDVILVFDFEPQQDVPRFELIRKLLKYFNNSTENGKLYINYPMMQSYRHFDKLPNKDFRDLKVVKEEAKHYKELVGNISKFKNVNHHSYPLFISIAYHHLLKLNYIINGKYEMPEINFIYNFSQLELFDIQCKLLFEEKYIYVINTFALFIVEYNPTEYYNQIKTHRARFSI